jgi:mannose-6-phosphate isomerase
MSEPFEVLVDHRPWGKFTQYSHNQQTTVKIIEVKPQQQLSVQRHQNRDELWVALDEGLWATIGDETIMLRKEHRVFIPRNTVHSIKNVKHDKHARFLEIAFGQFAEDDIERLEDKYGRA